MSDFLLKLVRSKRLSDEDELTLQRSFNSLRHSLISGTLPAAEDFSSAAALMFIYALHSKENKKEVLEFIDWFSQEDAEQRIWSPTLLDITEKLFGELQLNRIEALLKKINLRKSLTKAEFAAELVSNINAPGLRNLYFNKVEELNIDFSVSVLPFSMEVLDPRIVSVRPGKKNELHHHAHETVFIFLKGKGKVVVDEFENYVEPGDFAFIPRWSNHQSVNTGEEDLVFLAVADFGLTGKSFMGDYLKTARMKPSH
jgi:mannose-6-phosphate isomerase-like protein (cupin superfamily)